MYKLVCGFAEFLFGSQVIVTPAAQNAKIVVTLVGSHSPCTNRVER